LKKEKKHIIAVNCPYNCSLIGFYGREEKINDKLTANYTVINVERKERKKRVITINCPYNCSLIGIRENKTLIVVNCPYNCSLFGVLR